MPLKVTTWTLEHSNKLVTGGVENDVEDRRRRVRATIEEITPVILCIEEGPKGELAIDEFSARVLGRQ